jgi:hypothetical protein
VADAAVRGSASFSLMSAMPVVAGVACLAAMQLRRSASVDSQLTAYNISTWTAQETPLFCCCSIVSMGTCLFEKQLLSIGPCIFAYLAVVGHQRVCMLQYER